jgi:hypothetical protein
MSSSGLGDTGAANRTKPSQVPPSRVPMWEVFGRVALDGCFILIPVLIVVIIDVEKFVDPAMVHESPAIFELMLATMIFYADVLKETIENRLAWKKVWRVLRNLGLLVSVLGVFSVGIWFAAKTHPLAAGVLTATAAVTWFLVKFRVVYIEMKNTRYLIENFGQ